MIKDGLRAQKKGMPVPVKTTPAPGKSYPVPDLLGTVTNYLLTGKPDIKYQQKASKATLSLLFLVDSSGSMLKDRQIAYIKGIINQTITQHQHKRLRYAAVALSQGDAQLVSHYTTDTTKFIHSIAQLPSGGKTNLQAGLRIIQQLQATEQAQLYIFTDGRINAGGTLPEAAAYFRQYLRGLRHTTVVDQESGFVKLGKAAELAKVIGATYLNL